MNGRFVVSTAGHDAGKIYIMVGADNGMLFLADGVERRLANPKKKNMKHVTVLKEELSPELDKAISGKSRGCDEMMRQALHRLKKENPEYK